MNSKTKRVEWIDNARALMACFIILFHYTLTPKWLINLVYPFTLTFFFSVSGYFFRIDNNGFFCFLQKKAKAYFPIIIINALITCIFEGISAETAIFALKKIIFQIYGAESLWFVACSFIMQLLMYFIVTVTKGKTSNVLMGCIFFSIFGLVVTFLFHIKLPWSLDIALMYMVFMGIGFLYREKQNIVDIFINRYFYLLVIFYLTLVVIFPYNDMHRREYSCIWIFQFHAILGIALITLIFKKYFSSKLPVFSYLGNKSLYVYAFHGYGLVVYNRIINLFLNTTTKNKSLALAIGSVVFSLTFIYFGCSICELLFEKLKKKGLSLDGARNKK